MYVVNTLEPLPGVPICCRQTTLRTESHTEPLQDQTRVRSLDQGLSPAEGTPMLKLVVLGEGLGNR